MTRGIANNHFTTTDPHNHDQSAVLSDTPSHHQKHVHIAIIGTGFSGLGMAIRLKQRGHQHFVVLERAADVGGTWRDNTYPGCACDIPSNLYSFSFAPNPHWSHLYPSQPEIQEYLRHCAEHFGVLEHIRMNCEVQKAVWQEYEQYWCFTTAQGPLTADILITGQGPLTEPALPHIPGLEHFEGTVFHSARWDHNYDVSDPTSKLGVLPLDSTATRQTGASVPLWLLCRRHRGQLTRAPSGTSPAGPRAFT